MKINVTQDDWYVYLVRDNEKEDGEFQIELTEEEHKRYKRIFNNYSKMQEEIEQKVKEASLK